MRELTEAEKKVLDELRHTEADGLKSGFAKLLSYSMLERGFIAGLDHAAGEVDRLRESVDILLAFINGKITRAEMEDKIAARQALEGGER